MEPVDIIGGESVSSDAGPERPRGSIKHAIDFQRASDSIIEAVSAEDLGRLPDTSIADAKSRLRGLASQRAEGRASAISLRVTNPLSSIEMNTYSSVEYVFTPLPCHTRIISLPE